MIATRMTPALDAAKDVETATPNPAAIAISGTIVFQLLKLGLLMALLPSLRESSRGDSLQLCACPQGSTFSAAAPLS
jgi:hypothetical protein